MKRRYIVALGVSLITILGFSETVDSKSSFDGIILENYYENGQVKSKKEYKDGVLNGTTEYYFENGQLEIENQYTHGILNGFYKIYREDGSIRYSFIYINGILKD